MFNFRTKNIEPEITSLTNVSQDIHSHILPGIDDGSPDIDTSILLIEGLYNLGLRKAVATPHVIGDMYRNNPVTINNALEKVKAACSEKGIDMALSAAAEYMLDDHFMELLRKKEPLLTIEKNIILTELSYVSLPDNLERMCFEIITAGYQPIMAHPERYFFYHKKYDDFFRLKELGFLLQVNLLSLTGYYGVPVNKAAKFLFEKNLVDLVGTDMHHERHLELLSKKENLAIFKNILATKLITTFLKYHFSE
jgi:tyrosine-protein phosphatase YwqE